MQADTRSLLTVAAELRAAGQTWEAVARRVGRNASTCRRWPSRYAEEWRSVLESRLQPVKGDTAERHVPPAKAGTSTKCPVRQSSKMARTLPRRQTLPLAERAGNVADSLRVSPKPLPHSRSAALSSDPTHRIRARQKVAAVWAILAPICYGLLIGVAFGTGLVCGGRGTMYSNPPAAAAVRLPLVYQHHERTGSARAAAPLTSRPVATEIDPDAAPSREPPTAPRRTGTRRPVPDPDLDRLSDEDLLSRFRRGQREVFGTLVRRYQRELYGYLRRYLGDPHLADDVFQTTFVQVFSKAAQYEPGRPVRPWLYAIATNQAIDAMRRAGRHPAVSLEQTETESEGERRGLIDVLEARESDPFDNVDAAETRAVVRACIARLPEFLRQVLLMAYYQGLKYQEIADALEIPLGTVKSRLHAALVKLHEAWNEQVPSPESPVPSRDD